MLLPGTAICQIVVVREAGALRAGGEQLILGAVPVPVRRNTEPPVLVRLRKEPSAALMSPGRQQAPIPGFGSGEPSMARTPHAQPGVVFERSQSSEWMPKGDGVAQRQEVMDEQVSSDGLRQVRLVRCDNGHCETAIKTEHALLPAAGAQLSLQHNWRRNAVGELLVAPDPELVAKEKLEQLEQSVDEKADDEEWTKDGDADDDIQEYLDS